MGASTPRLRRTVRAPQARKARVGDEVGLEWAGKVLLALVVEDRGNLGAHGERIVRLDIPEGADEDGRWQIEVPVDWLVAAPAR